MEIQQLKERQRQLLKFGDRVVLGGVETGGFVSSTTDLEPQARVEVLRDGAASPPDYLQCRFEVVHKHQYIERNNFMTVLANCGIAADDNDDSHEDDVFLRGLLPELKATKEFKKLSPEDREEIAEAKVVFDKEKSVNSQELERLVGQPVLYGKSVQLRHPTSGLFLTVKRTAASVDRGALRLVLSSGHNASWFQIVSGYKTKGDGEQVSYGEVVSFMSSAYHGMAINYSIGIITEQSMLPVEVNPNIAESRELICSPLVGRFKVIPHSLHSSLIPGHSNLLTGCAAVRFVYHTSGAILTVSRNGNVQFEMHATEGLNPGAESLPRSDGLWQLQPEHLEWAGQPGEYNLKYRLIHIHSGKFLAAKPSAPGEADSNPDESEGAGAADFAAGMAPACAARLFTTPDQTLASTLWTFVPLAQGNGFTSELFSVRSYAFLQASCGQWLSQSQAQQKSRVFMTDNVEPRQAVISSLKRDDFVLEMTWVEEDVSSKAHAVRGCLQTMEGFALYLRSNHEKIPESLDRDATFDEIVAAIQASKLNDIFKMWYTRVYRTLLLMRQMVSVGSVEPGDVTVDANDAASYQQMCKESGLIRAVVNALDAVNLRMFFGNDGKAFVKQFRLGSQLITFGNLCHVFVQAACKGNTSVQNYVGDNFRNKLSAHLGGSVKASDTLAAIYKDNLQQIQDVGEKELLGFINLIRIEGRFPRFMNFLITQCGSTHRPVPRNQNIIAPGFFSDSGFLLVKGIKVVNESGKTDCDITWVDRNDGSVKSWRCGTIAGAHKDDLETADITEWFRSEAFIEKNPNITMFIFYIFQLKLFAAMCYGRNTIAQQILLLNGQQQGLGCDFDTLLDLVMSNAVPFALRKACLRLMLYLHIDVDPFFELKVPRTSRLISESDGSGAAAVPMMGTQNNNKSTFKRENAHALNNALINYLKAVTANTPVACTGQCSLTLMAVRTVKRMFELGILEISLGDRTRSTKILKVLQDVLRVIQPQQQPGNWRIVMDIKATICATLEFCLSLCTENQIKGMFEEFATARRTRSDGPASLDVMLSLPGVPSSDEEDSSLIVPEPEETEIEGASKAAPANFVMSDHKIEALAETLYRYNAAPQESLFYLDSVSLGDIGSGLGVTLLELCRYDHAKLSEWALRLLDKLLGRRRQLIRCMLDTLVVAEPETGLLYRRCENLLRLLAVEYKWVASTDKERKLAALTTCSECFQEMSRMLVPQIIAVPMESDEINGTITPVSGKHGPLTCEWTTVRSVELTENRVNSFKEVLHDLRATEMALQFLRLPMRCTKPVPGKGWLHPMLDAVEPERRELFGVVYEFLTRLCISETGSGDVTNNEDIQAYLAKEVPLYMGHVGIQFLNATSTISAIFQNNLYLSRRYLHESIIYRFVQLLLKFGEKRRTRWLTFLRTVAVVGGIPVARSQSVLLMTLSEVEDKVLSLCKTEDDKGKRSCAMAENCHLENKESGAAAQGSWLEYHRTSILLLADCTVGGDPTLVVKASCFLSLQEVLEGAMLPYSQDDTLATTTRYVTSAYWQFLRNVYFATDTKSTRMAVRDADNGIWDTEESESARASVSGIPASESQRMRLRNKSVIRWVIDEIELAMQPVHEPPTAAINSDIKYYASAMLPRFVFPALTNYFQRHYLAHSSQLPAAHTKTLRELVKSTMTFAFHLRDIHSRNGSKAFKQPRKSTKDFLVALQAASAQLADDARSIKAKFQGSIMMESMSENQDGSQFEGSDKLFTASQSKLVKHNWETFVTSLADKIGVQVNEKTGDLSEVRAVEQGQGAVSYASLHIMSRLLSQPHQLDVKRKGPSGNLQSLGWTWEEVPLHLCKLLIKQHNEISWSEETVIKMVRSMTLACYICDGHGVNSFEKLKVGWNAGLAREFPSDLSKAHLKWVQDKYNTLGFTQCAMSLMTNARLTVQMEALRLLHTLLIGGNVEVQNTMALILESDRSFSEAWFGSIEAVLVRCGETLKAQAARLENANDAPDDDLDDFDDLNEFDEEDDELEVKTTSFNDSHNPFVFASEIISMLQLMCEGHHTSNQIMMHEQAMNANSVDLLSECINLIGLMQSFLAESASSGKMQLPNLTMKICEFLTEACLGPCHPIQNMLALDSPLISLSNRMLSTIVIDDTDSPRVIQTKAKILSALLQVLCSLLEGSTDESISNRIKDVLDFSAVESQLIILMSRMTVSPTSEAANASFSPDEDFDAGGDEEELSAASFSSNPANMSMDCIDLNKGLPDIEEEPQGGVSHFSFRKRGSLVKRGNTAGMSEFELDAAGDDSSAPAEANQEEVAQDAIRSALLEMLFFIRKLNCKTMGRNTDLLHQGTEKEISKSVTDRMDTFMESSTASIELLWNGNIEKVFFPLTPMCRELDKNAKWKEELVGHLQSVPSECRSDPLQKSISLMHLIDVAVADLTAIGHLNQNFKWCKFIVDNQRIAWRLSFVTSALILTIMTLSVRESVQTWQSSSRWSYWLCLALCYFQFALTLLIMVSFASYDATRWRTITDPKFGSRVMEWIATGFNGITCMRSARAVDDALGGATWTVQEQPIASSFGSFVHSESSRYHGAFAHQFDKILSKVNPPPKDDDLVDIYALMHNAAVIVLDVACFWRTWFILALLVSAILGLSRSPFYTTFFLTVFFVEFSAGKTIVRALGEAGMPLLKTSLMGVVVIIVFSVASFVFFREADVEGLQCETMYQCVATHLITGMYGDFSVLFYDGGEIHQIVPLGIDDDAVKQMQVFFVLGFFIIWGFVLSNIFTGQVVDAFASIRAEEANVQHDNATRCLVCSLERFDFDKNPKTSFDYHTSCEHNPVAYVYYLHYLRTTETTEFKGYDTAVAEMLSRQSLVERSSWLPINRSITLENLEAAGTKSLEVASEKQTDLLEYLKSMVQRMDARITGIESQLQRSSQ